MYVDVVLLILHVCMHVSLMFVKGTAEKKYFNTEVTSLYKHATSKTISYSHAHKMAFVVVVIKMV